MTSLSFCLAWFLLRLLRREYLEMREEMEGEIFFLFVKQILLGPGSHCSRQRGGEGFRVSDNTESHSVLGHVSPGPLRVATLSCSPTSVLPPLLRGLRKKLEAVRLFGCFP